MACGDGCDVPGNSGASFAIHIQNTSRFFICAQSDNEDKNIPVNIMKKSNTKKLSVAILSAGFVDWGGGIEFLRHILHGLLWIKKERNLKIYLILEEELKHRRIGEVTKNIFKFIFKDKLNFLTKISATGNVELLQAISSVATEIEIIRYNGNVRSLENVLSHINAEVILPCIKVFGKRFSVPWIGYIWDFQHRYYPNYFKRHEIFIRDRHFRLMVKNAKVLLVNSISVKEDINRFFPGHSSTVIALPFLAPLPKEWLDPSPLGLPARYKLPKKYFLISNQFWIHKSHPTAFKALRYLLDHTGKKDIFIVCTGLMYDYRFPGYMGNLMEEISELRLQDHILLLGHIPKFDQICIMKGCIAVIQPTLFEGGPGGGSVYDAVALGVPSIVSDIPVNKEIVDNNVLFFKAGSEQDLYQNMLKIIDSPRRIMEMEELMSSENKRVERYAAKLLEAIQSARSDFHPGRK